MTNPGNKYVVRLTEEEREKLLNLVRGEKVAAYKRRHAQILLKTDEGGGRSAVDGRSNR